MVREVSIWSGVGFGASDPHNLADFDLWYTADLVPSFGGVWLP